MTPCLCCGRPLDDTTGEHHAECLHELFGTSTPLAVDVDLARLHTLALAMVGRVSVSGVQRKLSVHVDTARATLQIAAGPSRYLLKPQAATFPHLPENEWVTQRLAALAGIVVPPAALLRLRDDSFAYVVRRFDRRDDGRKRAMEDFCQLAGLQPAEKYSASTELCGRIVARFASEPLIEQLRLYRQVRFAWWVGNGDLHLKNLALLREDDGLWRLSPAFDQLNTRLVLPDDALALPIDGKRDNLKPASWRRFGERLGLGSRARERVDAELRAALPDALALLAAAPLPDTMRRNYADLLQARAP